jgi:ketopantoate reductase
MQVAVIGAGAVGCYQLRRSRPKHTLHLAHRGRSMDTPKCNGRFSENITHKPCRSLKVPTSLFLFQVWNGAADA